MSIETVESLRATAWFEGDHPAYEAAMSVAREHERDEWVSALWATRTA